MKSRKQYSVLFFFLILIFLSPLLSKELLVFSPSYIPGPDSVFVFTPSSPKTERMPAVLLLHGWTGKYSDWSIIAQLQSYADELNFILICPDGFYDSWYIDSYIQPNSQMERFIIEALVPEIKKKYPVDTANVFITGLSMGGHGGMTLFLKHPDVFKAGGSTSGILDLTKYPGKWGMEKNFGQFENNLSRYADASAINLLQKAEKNGRELIIDCGTEDFAYDVNKAFYEECLKRKIKCTFISQPGVHNRNYWETSIDQQLRFFRRLANTP